MPVRERSQIEQEKAACASEEEGGREPAVCVCVGARRLGVHVRMESETPGEYSTCADRG